MNRSIRHARTTIPTLLAVAGLALPAAAQVGTMDDDARFGGSAGQSAQYQDTGVYDRRVYDADDWRFTRDQGWFDEDLDQEFRGWRGEDEVIVERRIYGTDDELIHDDDLVDLDADPTDGDDDGVDFNDGVDVDMDDDVHVDVDDDPDDDVDVDLDLDDDPDRERKSARPQHADDDFYVEERVYGIWGDYGANEDAGQGTTYIRERQATVRTEREFDRDDSESVWSDSESRRMRAAQDDGMVHGRTYHTDADHERAMIGSVRVIDLRESGRADRAAVIDDDRTFGIAEERMETRTAYTAAERTPVRRPVSSGPYYPQSEYSLWAEYGSEDEEEYWAEGDYPGFGRDEGWYDPD